MSALFRSGCSCKLCERPLQDAYKSCLIFVSRGDGAAWAVSSVIACSGTEGTGISRVLGSVSSGANSVSKSLFPIISFLVFFFPVLTFLRASFIHSHRAAGAVVLPSLGCYREGMATTPKTQCFTIFWTISSLFLLLQYNSVLELFCCVLT